ncbi:LPS export ABC transporter periplasmic protein LptC [Teredinibacter haidensis]|uniref:LPS export ABC transporter periplasmic protein LptC n=1 Tax=Teredinibacter haidensis TaxID=2731755 RepID=UPI000948A551|nr:LPS export ABC transporter periplasmic protein LptC [Teredinibacter haidensis]
MVKNRLYILFICLGISAIVMLWDSSEEILTPPKWQDEDGHSFPYAVAKDASTQHFGDQGKLDYSFTASKLEHYRVESADNKTSAEEYTLIFEPRFEIYEEKAPWQVEAENGKLVRNTEQITLWNNVRIWQSETLSNIQPTELNTSSLTINPAEKVAYTQEPVKIHSAYGEIDAVGMTADFRQRKIKLHNKVKAIHRNPTQANRDDTESLPE